MNDESIKSAWTTLDGFARDNWSVLPEGVQEDMATLASFVEGLQSYPESAEDLTRYGASGDILTTWSHLYSYADDKRSYLPVDIMSAVDTLNRYATSATGMAEEDETAFAPYVPEEDPYTPALHSVEGWLAKISSQLDRIISQR